MKENKGIKINRLSIKVLALSCAIWSAAQLGFVPSGYGADPPSVIGQWGDVMDWSAGITNGAGTAISGRNVGVHLVLLPTGKVIMYPYTSLPRLWNPATSNLTTLAFPGTPEDRHNIFCAGHSHVPDGRVLFTGGEKYNESVSRIGERQASYFNPFDSPWTTLTDMSGGASGDAYGRRWYPTSTALPNGEVLVTSGFTYADDINPLPQAWNPVGEAWRNLTSATNVVPPPYTRTFLAPNGKVFFAQGETNANPAYNLPSYYLDTSGNGTWSTYYVPKLPGHNNLNNPLAATVMDEAGTVYWFGGGEEKGSSPGTPIVGCEKINLAVNNSDWTLIASMPEPRKFHTATILPTGQILITSGTTTNDPGDIQDGVDNNNGKFALFYNPAADTWTTLAKEHKFRGYHSTALLLPDGRVLSVGGNDPHHNNPDSATAEIFSPPYLFKPSSSDLADRPVITSAPAVVGYGETFFVGTPDAATITNVTWTRLGNTTHGFNWDQRINTLTYARTYCGLNVTSPANTTNCQPGYYMLWLINSSGVPSVSRIIRISTNTPMFNLTHWNLTLPVDANDTFTGSPREVSTAELNSGFEYVDPYGLKKYFFMGAGGLMIFQTPTNGAIQSGETDAGPRSELRGTLANGDEHNWTPGSEGGVHILDGLCSVNAGLGRIVIGQIHAKSGAGVPAVALAYDTTGSAPFFRVTVKHDPDDPNNGQTTHDFAGVPLNGLIHYQLKMVGGSNSVLLYATVNGVTWTMDMNSNSNNWTNTTFYYKAGCFFTNFLHGSPPAQVTFYKLFQSEIPVCGGGLVAMWRGEGNANDVMGRNNGTLAEGAAANATGIAGTGFALDGYNDYVRIPHSSTLHLSNEISMEMWYKPSGQAPAGGLFDKRDMTTCNYGAHFNLYNTITVYYNDPTPGGFEYTTSPEQSAGPYGVFHHLVVTYKQTPTNVLLQTYIDGELVQTGAQPGTLANSYNGNATALALGSIRDNAGDAGAGYNFYGTIDEVALYDRVLSADEVLVHYQAPAGTVARWHGDGSPADAMVRNPGYEMEGVAYADTMLGCGFLLDGTNDYVRIPDYGSLRLATTFSIELWYFSDSNAYGGVLDKRNYYTCNFGIHFYTATNLVTYYNDPNYGGFEYTTTPSGSLGTARKFHHLVATYKQTNSSRVEIRTYIDGELAQAGSQNGNLGNTFNVSPYGSPDPGATVPFGLAIGSIRNNLGGVGYNFDGIIDEVSLYHHVMDTNEVRARYLSAETDTIAAWTITRDMGDSSLIVHSWTPPANHSYYWIEIQRWDGLAYVPWDSTAPEETTWYDYDSGAVSYRVRMVSPRGPGPWVFKSVAAP